MTDKCSVASLLEIKKSGYLGKKQEQYVSVFINSLVPLTHREATNLVEIKFNIKLPERNGRIAELEEMGFLEKVDVVICDFTKKRVNRWRYTGRTDPLDFSMEWRECKHCEGKGGKITKVYHKLYKEEQTKMF